MVSRASLARELGSPAAFSLDSTPRETRRSSSRASRKTTREPESTHSQSSYSLPPTPVTTSFDESLPSAKRRKTQRSVNQTAQTPQGKEEESVETPGSLDSPQPTENLPKRRDRNRKAVNTNAELTPNTNTESPSEPATAQAKSRPEQSQSTLHHFLLKKPQSKRHSLATTTLPTATVTPRVTSSASATPRASSTSASSPRMASTPGSARKDRNSKSAKPPAQIKTEPTPAHLAPASTPDNSISDPQTPAASSRPSTPRNSTSRARRADRKPTKNPATSSRLNPATGQTPSTATEPRSTPTTSSKMGQAKSVLSHASQKGSARPQRSSSRRSRVEAGTRSSAPDTNHKNMAQTNHKVSDFSSGAESSTPALPIGREIAESIESATPVSDNKILGGFGTPLLPDDNNNNTPGAIPYGDSFDFEYDADMYRSHFGLDGTTETPGSPTGSLTTATSVGNRISTRLRKPTIKAMESIESERRFRRPPRSASARPDGPKGPPLEWDAVALGIRIFEMANSALAPEFEPAADAEQLLAELRGAYDIDQAEREKLRLEQAQREKETEKEIEKEKATATATATPEPVNGSKEIAEHETGGMEMDETANGEKTEGEKVNGNQEREEKRNSDQRKVGKRNAEKEKAAKEKAAKEKAEREKIEKEKADKEQAEKETAEREQAEKEKAKKEKAEKQLSDASKTEKRGRTTRRAAATEQQPATEAKTEEEAGGASKPTSPADQSKEWTDADGFTYTGRLNQFGEELVYVGRGYEWYRPNNTYGDDKLPLPPVRLISREQLEKDRIFGFPPLMGERNIPRARNMPFTYEDVLEERAKIKAREEARKRGIEVDRYMPSAYIHALIAQHDKTSSDQERSGAGVEPKGPAPRKRRRAAEQPTEAAQAAKRRRKEDTPPAAGDQPKTLRIKLTLKGAAAAAAAAKEPSSPNEGGSKKRTRSETEAAPEMNGTTSSDTPQNRPTKLLKLSGLRRDPDSTPAKSTASPATPGGGETNTTAPAPSPASGSQAATPANDASSTALGTTPGGRPRRRAAAALMAEFQNHAEQRARRANARKKEPAA